MDDLYKDAASQISISHFQTRLSAGEYVSFIFILKGGYESGYFKKGQYLYHWILLWNIS